MGTNIDATKSHLEMLRLVAAERMKTAAAMTLHELVDEFRRLTAVMSQNTAASTAEDDYSSSYPRLNETGLLAMRERQIIVGAANVRFGVTFASPDDSFAA